MSREVSNTKNIFGLNFFVCLFTCLIFSVKSEEKKKVSQFSTQRSLGCDATHQTLGKHAIPYENAKNICVWR